MLKRIFLIGSAGLVVAVVFLGLFYLGVTSRIFAQDVSPQDLYDARLLYEDARGFESSHDYDRARLYYNEVASQYSNTVYVGKSVLGLSKVSVLECIDYRDDYNSVNRLNQLVLDYAGNPDLPYALCDIVRCYRQSRRFDYAASLGNYIIANYPGGDTAMKALGELVITYVLNHQDANAAGMLNSLVSDYASHPNLPALLDDIARQSYYHMGCKLESDGRIEQAKSYYQDAIGVWEIITEDYPNSELSAEAFFYAGECYHKTGNYSKSIDCYQYVVDNYPDYELVWLSQFMVGRNYESMKKSGLLDASHADPNISNAYTAVLEIDPNCKASKIAKRWLESHNTQ